MTTAVTALHPLLADRHSPRAFDASETVTEDQLGLLLDAARWAPSASNTQPWRFLAGRRGERAFDVLLAALVPGNQAWARDAGALVLVAAETADEEGTPRPWAVYDAGQAAGHLTAQATALGLSVRQMGGFIPADEPWVPGSSREIPDQRASGLSGAKPSRMFADRVRARTVLRFAVLRSVGVDHDVVDLDGEPGGRKVGPQDLRSRFPECVVRVAEPERMTRQPCSSQQDAQPFAIP